ncbi:MAG TPA: MATE family efflux transporter [Polyangiales bacterium]|nr:MATE family efflux transporter [Polyangiales bacterium]
MSTDHANRNLSWRQRPFAEVLRLAWPIGVSLLSFSTMTAVDTLFIGHLGPTALAGVALGSATTFTLFCFGMGLLRSSHITISQAVGAGQRQRVLAYLGAGIVVAVGLGLLTACLGQVVASFADVFTASGESALHAATYTRVRSLGAPLLFVELALSGARYGSGDSRSSMIAVLTANAVNVVLVAFFSLALHAGVSGVAAATVLSQVVEVYVLARRQSKEGFGLAAWTQGDVRVLLRTGVPLGIERFFDMGAFGLMILIMARMGDLELAAHQVAHQALLFGFMPIIAIGDASTVLIGQAVGAGRIRMVPRVQRAALCAGLCYAALCSVAYLSLARVFAQQFTQEKHVVDVAVQLLRIAAGFVFIWPFYSIGQATLRAIGDVKAASIITVIAAWGCTPLFAAWFGIGLGLGAPGGYFGIATEVVVGALAFWWRIRGDGAAWVRNLRRFRSELRRAEGAEPVAGEVVVSNA